MASEQPKPQYPGKLLQAAAIAKPFQEGISSEIQERTAKSLPVPKLVGILAKPAFNSVRRVDWQGL